MDIRFDDRTVLVTGASTGIGAAVATAYGVSGARVAVQYGSSADAAAAVVQRVRDAGGEAWAVQADLADHDAPQRLAEQVQERYGRVDVLVNNAGGLPERRPTGEVSRELYDAVLQLNLASVVALCGAVVPAMRAAGSGSILNVSSVAAVTGGRPGASLYAAAKGAVVSYTRALAKELAADGVRVNCLSPRVIDTPFHDRYTSPEGMVAMVSTIPMGRTGAADECVGAALFLTHGGMSGYVSGQVLAANAGQHFLG